MPCFAFFYRQGLFRGQLQRPHIPSITGSISIFSTTLHTSWWLFLLLCGPMLHINMESSCLVSRKAKYNRSRSCLVTSISILNFSEQIWNGILIRFFCPHVCPPIPMLWLATFPGTFITEWTDGAAMCEAFLKDEESYRAVADKLVQISHCYGFDGWLINIENELSVSNTFLKDNKIHCLHLLHMFRHYSLGIVCLQGKFKQRDTWLWIWLSKSKCHFMHKWLFLI